eukprot:5031705-Pleurochrysis_carterae.AAC.1
MAAAGASGVCASLASGACGCAASEVCASAASNGSTVETATQLCSQQGAGATLLGVADASGAADGVGAAASTSTPTCERNPKRSRCFSSSTLAVDSGAHALTSDSALAASPPLEAESTFRQSLACAPALRSPSGASACAADPLSVSSGARPAYHSMPSKRSSYCLTKPLAPLGLLAGESPRRELRSGLGLSRRGPRSRDRSRGLSRDLSRERTRATYACRSSRSRAFSSARRSSRARHASCSLRTSRCSTASASCRRPRCSSSRGPERLRLSRLLPRLRSRRSSITSPCSGLSLKLGLGLGYRRRRAGLGLRLLRSLERRAGLRDRLRLRPLCPCRI